MSSFKVPCPSCEAQVLIKNPNLVGSKVECPKCKYRFKVEAPAEEPAKDAAKPGAKDAKPADAAKKDKKDKKDKKAKSGKGQNKKLIGIGLAVGAVALLGIGGYVMFGGDDSPKKSTSVTPRPPGAVTPSGDGTENGGEGEKKDGDGTPGKKDNTPPAAPPAKRSDKETTNLLPGKTVAVYRFDVGRIHQTPVGGMLFDAATKDLVKASMGFELGDIETYLHCSVGEKDRAPVGVIRLRTPFHEKQLTGGVAGAGPAKAVGGKTLIPVASNPLLSAAGNALAARTILADVYTAPPPPPAKPVSYAVCVYDTQHVLVGEAAALEAHLAGLKDGYPEFQTVVQKDEPPPTPAPAAAGDTPMPPPAAPPPPTQTDAKKGFTTNPKFLSLEPKLRLVMLTMNTDPLGEPLFVQAEKFDDAAYPRKGVRKEYAPVAEALDPVLSRTTHVGSNVLAFTPRQVTANVRFFGKSDSDARLVALEKLAPTFRDALPVLSLLLQTNIEFRNHADPNYVPPAGTGAPGEGNPGQTPYPMGTPAGPPRGTPMGSPPILGGGSPMIGMIGPMGGRGEAGQQIPGTPFPGMPIPGMPMPGMPTDPTRPAQPSSHVALRLIDEVVAVRVELNWPDDTYSRLLGPRLLGYVNQLKGKAAVYSGTETWHALGRAVKQYTTERKEFPAGTVPVARESDQDTRLGVAYPPAQRASFFVELLPALGRTGLRQELDPAQGWLADRNAPVAGSWVPELLVTYYPQSAWRATSPLAPDFTFGGTNFVAVAGVGHEAPRFDPKKPADAKRAGITGYDWGSKLEEVTDGPENTIYLLQTPPGAPRPWAAGGGATVVGLDPTNPMAAFKHKRPDGKEGTYAVMGDGTIRWLPADIAPKVMLEMATRAGGEKLPNLDEIAPRVPRGKEKPELKADAVATQPPAPPAPAPAAAPGVQPTPPTAPAPRAPTDAATRKD